MIRLLCTWSNFELPTLNQSTFFHLTKCEDDYHELEERVESENCFPYIISQGTSESPSMCPQMESRVLYTSSASQTPAIPQSQRRQRKHNILELTLQKINKSQEMNQVAYFSEYIGVHVREMSKPKQHKACK
ncbi:hypothetical protein CDAR_9232 [Caerostris darwini]|uniref:Uncharacterized protein n=1 Tax=Caerostris darwini TaxID=1538125 RepID=A0AAV4VVB2_9ARAC|nr:hypothetical protein CDAR_9232 [Caerostris darwini]